MLFIWILECDCRGVGIGQSSSLMNLIKGPGTKPDFGIPFISLKLLVYQRSTEYEILKNCGPTGRKHFLKGDRNVGSGSMRSVDPLIWFYAVCYRPVCYIRYVRLLTLSLCTIHHFQRKCWHHKRSALFQMSAHRLDQQYRRKLQWLLFELNFE